MYNLQWDMIMEMMAGLLALDSSAENLRRFTKMIHVQVSNLSVRLSIHAILRNGCEGRSIYLQIPGKCCGKSGRTEEGALQNYILLQLIPISTILP